MKNKLVRLSVETHSRLTDLGKKGETYDQIVERVLDEAQKWRIVREEFIKKLPTMYTKDRMEFIRKIEKLFKESGLMQEIST